MKSPYVVALIARDAVEHLPVTVPSHEVPVLALVHGEDRVSILEDADLPQGLTEMEFEPEDEYARVSQRYGNHPDTKQSYASMVYGGLAGFVRGLEDQEADATNPAPRRGRRKAAELTA